MSKPPQVVSTHIARYADPPKHILRYGRVYSLIRIGHPVSVGIALEPELVKPCDYRLMPHDPNLKMDLLAELVNTEDKP